MDANLQFWPKVGETVTHTGSKPTETFKVTEIREEFPCAVYIIRSKHDGRMVRAHRHELDPVTPPRTAETPTLHDLVHTSNRKYSIKKRCKHTPHNNHFVPYEPSEGKIKWATHCTSVAVFLTGTFACNPLNNLSIK